MAISPSPAASDNKVAPSSAPGVPGRASPRRKRTAAVWFVAAAIASAALSWSLSSISNFQLWGLSSISGFQLLELTTYDLRVIAPYNLRWLLRIEQPPPSSIAVVVLDARTERAFPDDPRIFWHPHFASLLRAAAAGEARAIGLDIAFGLSVEKWAPDYDRQLAEAFAEVSASVPVILTYDNLQGIPDGLPLYILGTTQGAIGYTNLTTDPDSFVRRQELRSKEGYESFAARLAAVASDAEWEAGVPPERALRLGGREVPLDRSGFLRIHYWGPKETFRPISMAAVLAEAEKGNRDQLAEWFRGKIVLIGVQGPEDQKPMPFSLFGGEQQFTSGVEIHANILATLLEGRFLREASPVVGIGLTLLLAFLAAWLVTRFRLSVALNRLDALLVFYFAASVLAMEAGLIIPVVPPMLAVILSGLFSYGVYSRTEGRKRRLLEDMFGRYVSPEVAQEVLAREEIPLGGTRQPVTVMFCDLRNYTSYCQGRDPQQVVAELNEYFTDMTAEIKAHGGMVNKFIGDGIMALFGAPVPHAEDPLRAVACALRMIERNDAFNRRRAEQGLPPLVLGVGIHTGEAVVGTIGAPEKMEYTAIGDTVNVASRIEGENKTFETQLLVSEATYRLIRDCAEGEQAGIAHLKGVSPPMPVFRVHKVSGIKKI